MRRMLRPLLLLLSVTCGFGGQHARAQQEVIPHRQDRPPGPALSPQEAIAKMTVPEGFQIELVASEPDLVNPVAMTIDERGRFWITESLEYPRREAGPGRDRIKVLEDTDGDGQADKFTVFADGLNIPSGIAVGFGGVWVANSPDILFMQDTDGDGKADQKEVVVTGFARRDTHELPNSLTWGPDGWLYGLNGVFNNGHVRYPESSPHYSADHPGWPIDAAMFRIHPQTREFQIFARGTSNPWGIAWNEDGEAFLSACVIDHLWHITETGYYHRQAGAYPPFTWKIESIVDYKHQKAAYCGIHWFDSDAYPEPYRRRLFMGNIHGGCINVDRIARHGSTYQGTGEPDFLTANDAWFMPVVQKTGPDGCLYILDWYDRYHCYQDANRDPAGIDRLKGRLYRVRYQDTPRRWNFNLAAEDDGRLIEYLGASNDYLRSTAQRLLQERGNQETLAKLTELVLDENTSEIQRRHALFTLTGFSNLTGHEDTPEVSTFVRFLLSSKDPVVRAKAVRKLAEFPFIRSKLQETLSNAPWDRAEIDPTPEVQLYSILALSTFADEPGVITGIFKVLAASSSDPLLPKIAWKNLSERLTSDDALNRCISGLEEIAPDLVDQLAPRIVERVLAQPEISPQSLARLLTVIDRKSITHTATSRFIDLLFNATVSGELRGDRLTAMQTALLPALARVEFIDALYLRALWGDATSRSEVRNVASSETLAWGHRIKACETLLAIGDKADLPVYSNILTEHDGAGYELRVELLRLIARSGDANIAAMLIQTWPQTPATEQPFIIEALTQRPAWTRQLLAAIGEKQIPANALNINQVRRLLETDDEEIKQLVASHWGTIRTTRDPKRTEVIDNMRTLIRSTPGDAVAGEAVFKKVCAQCHTIYGTGQQVGPDITRNGRASFEQLLSNVFDPSLVIGAGYQARTVVTTEGRVLTGLPVEESEQRVILKVQGGKQETIARGDIDIFKVSELSMMPEQLETQLKPQELADLFAFVTLDRHPSDPEARLLPGTRVIEEQRTNKPEEFNSLLHQVAPQFSINASGEDGVVLLPEFRGRYEVFRTHPVSADTPATLVCETTLPADRKSTLHIAASHEPRGDWTLAVRVNGELKLLQDISSKFTPDGWVDLTVDLSEFAGKPVKVEVNNVASGWSWEFGYWQRLDVVSE